MASCAPGGNGGRGVTPPLTRSAITAAGMVHPNAVDLGARRLRATWARAAFARLGPSPRSRRARPAPVRRRPAPVRARAGARAGPPRVPVRARARAEPVRCPRVPGSPGMSGRHRGPAHDHVNSAAYKLRNFHEKRNLARSRRAGRAGAAPLCVGPRPSPHTAHIVTTNHSGNGVGRALCSPLSPPPGDGDSDEAQRAPGKGRPAGTSSRTAQDISTVSAGTA